MFILSPVAYSGISILNDSKRTAYPGKEISRLVENKWNQNFRNEIKLVIGDEWYAGNLSYHLSSRPKWMKRLKNDKSKLDISGSEIWNKSYSSELNWKGYHNHVNADINQAHDGGYIITSSSKVSGWNHDIVLMKTDSDGNISGLFE